MANPLSVQVLEQYQKNKIKIINTAIQKITKILLTSNNLDSVLKIVLDARHELYKASVAMQQSYRAVQFDTTYSGNSIKVSKNVTVQSILDEFNALNNSSLESSGTVAVKEYPFYRDPNDDGYAGFFNSVFKPYYDNMEHKKNNKFVDSAVGAVDRVDANFAVGMANGLANSIARPSRNLNNDLLVFENLVEELEKDFGKVKYGRLPEPGACAFCIMLASRGAVYSASSVLSKGNAWSVLEGDNFDKQTPKMFPEADKYHKNCRCVAYPVYEDSEVPEQVQEAMKLYKEFKDSGESSLSSYLAWFEKKFGSLSSS